MKRRFNVGNVYVPPEQPSSSAPQGVESGATPSDAGIAPAEDPEPAMNSGVVSPELI